MVFSKPLKHVTVPGTCYVLRKPLLPFPYHQFENKYYFKNITLVDNIILSVRIRLSLYYNPWGLCITLPNSSKARAWQNVFLRRPSTDTSPLQVQRVWRNVLANEDILWTHNSATSKSKQVTWPAESQPAQLTQVTRGPWYKRARNFQRAWQGVF